MHITRSHSALALVSLLVAACSGGGGGSASTELFVETCSLGCGSGGIGFPINCTISEISQTQEIAVRFSGPVDPASLNASTFQLLNVDNSSVPLGSLQVDPSDPNRVVFRPALTLNLDGTVDFGFDPAANYRVLIPGSNQGDSPPFITSVSGRPNTDRLECFITTSPTPEDLQPGAPTAEVLVDQVAPGGEVVPDLPAADLENVSPDTRITVRFDELMTTAGLVVNGASTQILVELDTDGILATTQDRVLIAGEFAATLDVSLQQTTVTFTPSAPLPPPGVESLRRVVVTLSAQITDLAQNPLENPGAVAFTTVQSGAPTDPADIASIDFDPVTSALSWEMDEIVPGVASGGSGRHGSLVVETGEVLVLDTDSQVFPVPAQSGFSGQRDRVSTNLEPGVDFDPQDPASWPTIVQTDGVFRLHVVFVVIHVSIIC